MKQREILDTILMKLISIETRMETFATKDELFELEDRISNRIDGFLKLHLKHDDEIASLIHAYKRHDQKIGKLEGVVFN